MVKIIPESEHFLPFTGAGAYAEKKTLEFLKLLPDDHYVLREYKMNSSASKRLSGSLEDRPDFVVIGLDIGVVVLEVKDWNIHANSYQFVDQYRVRKTNIVTGNSEMLKNPYDQVDEYLNAILDTLKKRLVSDKLWVSSFVVYPKLIRSDFENMCMGVSKGSPQQRFILDLRKTLFLDDLETFRDAPLKLLQRFVVAEAKAHQRQVVTYTEQQVEEAVYDLLTPEMRVGGLLDDSGAGKKLATLDKEQQQWAFSSELAGKTYLSDVAGSGKTNVLLSRAIYWAKQHIATGRCRILVVTYSKALKIELERIFGDKIEDDSNYDYYHSSIYIHDVVSLMEEIVKEGMGERLFEVWRAQFLSSHPKSEYDEEKLPEKCFDVLAKNNKRFQSYDYLLIDEVQDFSTWFLEVSMSLLKDRQNIFTVGDIGQKLYDRELEWGAFDIVRQRVEIQSRFLMYRSPQPVAKLAWKFLTSDSFLLQDLKEEGYKTDIKPKSAFRYKPVFIPRSTEEELLQHACDDIRERLYAVNPKRILCIGLKDRSLTRLHHALTAAAIPVRWATEAESRVGDYLILADYVESKGLERDYVYILDADRLAGNIGPFASTEQVRKETRRDRIKLFVALTRAIREVRLYYIDRHHTFIRELLHIQSTL